MRLLNSHKLQRERETADPPEAENDAFQETRDLREDIRRKRDAAATTASSESITVVMSPGFQTDEEKFGLAVRTSVASIPGAYNGQNQRRLPKPSQEELLVTARLSVKEDIFQPDMGPQLSSAEVRPIDDLQVRMKDFQLGAAIEDLGEKRGQQKRRSRKVWAAIAVFFAVVIGAVVGATLALLGGKGRNVEEPSVFDMKSCYSRSDELSERYDSFRFAVVSLFPDMATAIDTSYSSASVALCWVSDFDEFELEISEGNDFELIQRFALTAVYFHFENTTGNVASYELSKQNWLSGLHVCKWGFVDCYNTGEDQIQYWGGPERSVTGLAVGSVGLTGRIPAELAMLKNLLHLRFADNQLTGSIPSELGILSQLNNLDLYDNQLTGSIPSELELLNQLNDLDLRFNHLTGSLSSRLSILTQLNSLLLANNKLTGSIPSEVGLLTQLTCLDLASNQLTGSIPSEVGLLTQITLLDLATNGLTGSISSELGLLNQLNDLDLRFNQLTGSLSSRLGLLTQLKIMKLSDNELTGSIPSQLGLVTQLVELALSSNQLTGSIPSQLFLLSQLEGLYIFFNQLTGSLPSELGLLNRTLKLLHLANNKLTGSIPSQLGLFDQLQLLSVYDNQLVGSIPSSLCSHGPAKLLIDCGEIACTCCVSKKVEICRGQNILHV